MVLPAGYIRTLFSVSLLKPFVLVGCARLDSPPRVELVPMETYRLGVTRLFRTPAKATTETPGAYSECPIRGLTAVSLGRVWCLFASL